MNLFRSQGAKLVLWSNKDIVDKEEAMVHLIRVGSTVLKTVVDSTSKAERHQLTDVVEAADLIRAAFAYM